MFYQVMLGVSVYRRGKPRHLHFGVEAATCLDAARLLGRSLGGEVSISLLPSFGGGLWTWYRPKRLRVPATFRKKFGKRAAREFEAQLNRRSP